MCLLIREIHIISRKKKTTQHWDLLRFKTAKQKLLFKHCRALTEDKSVPTLPLLHLTERTEMEVTSEGREENFAKRGKERKKDCPNLALILSHENLTLPYCCDSLPLKGNSSVVCRITESGRIRDQSGGSLFRSWRVRLSLCSVKKKKKRSNEMILYDSAAKN